MIAIGTGIDIAKQYSCEVWHHVTALLGDSSSSSPGCFS